MSRKPHPLTKPVTRRINQELVITITSAGVICRRYKCRKAILVPWEYVVDVAVRRAAGKPPSGRLFEDPRRPDLAAIDRFTLQSLSQLDDIATATTERKAKR